MKWKRVIIEKPPVSIWPILIYTERNYKIIVVDKDPSGTWYKENGKPIDIDNEALWTELPQVPQVD